MNDEVNEYLNYNSQEVLLIVLLIDGKSHPETIILFSKLGKK